MVALYASKPAVASMSLGLAVSQATNDAIDSMFYNGVVVSVSAGNDNSDACGQSPASAQNVSDGTIFLYKCRPSYVHVLRFLKSYQNKK